MSSTHGTMTLLPPAPNRCQVCAGDHPPHLPHNRDSLYYQMAHNLQYGGWPTWADAMEHCDDAMRMLWTKALVDRGQQIGEVTVKTLKSENL